MTTTVEYEALLGAPLKQWEGNCYGAAVRIAPHTDGVAVYGHWTGPIDEASMFGGRGQIGFARHGWIEMPDGSVIDPTRWVFEAAMPYVFEGSNEHYDRGGNALRLRMLRPPPGFDADEEQYVLGLSLAAWQHCDNLLGKRDHAPPGTVSLMEAVWIANLPLGLLDAYAGEVFQKLIDAGLAAYIPIDNRHAVLGEEPQP